MNFKFLLQNILTRLRHRNDFPAHVSSLASQAAERLGQLSVTLERYTDQEKGLTPRQESQKALFDEMDRRFCALWKKLDELKDAADRRGKNR